MIKRKIIIDILVIIIAFMLFVTWYENTQKSIPTTSSSKNYLIYLITMDKLSQYWHIVDSGVSDMAKLLGLTYIWDSPNERIVSEQIKIIDDAVKAGADVILIAVSDPDKVAPSLKAAKDKGTKIIYIDSPAPVEGVITLATDNYSAGITAGETMLFQLASNGIQTGTIGIVGVTPENAPTVNREKGFRDTINTDGKFKLLETKYSSSVHSDEEQIATTFINDNPDLVGLFGTNENTTVGVGNAINKSQKPIIGIGFDLTDTIQRLIDNGSLKAVMVQNPYTIGYLGMAEAFAALKGYDTGPSYINTGVSVRTQFSH